MALTYKTPNGAAGYGTMPQAAPLASIGTTKSKVTGTVSYSGMPQYKINQY